MKEQGSELFFVQVKEPTEVRRDILETLKDIVEVLQSFEKFKRTRHEKLGKIQKLRSLIKETNKTLGSLRLRLPQTNLRASVAREPQAQPIKAHHKKKRKQPEQESKKKEKTEVEKLEAELNAIESRLKSLA